MADYVLSAELSLQDRFTSKLKAATYQSNKFKSTVNNLESKLKKLEKIKSFEKVAQKDSSVLRVMKKLGSTNSFDKMREKIGKVGSSVKKLGNHFNNLGNRIGKISSKISNFGGKIKKAIKWGVAGTAGALGGGLKIGGDFEALSARMVTAFQGDKKKAAEYYKWANEFANETPFGNDEVIDATVRLKAYKYDPKRLLTILGDMAGAYGKTLEQSVEAYADASRGEFERLKEFGIQKDEVLKYAKKTMGKEVKMSGAQIKDMDTFMKALEGLIKSRSKDGMKNLAKTLKGMLSTTTGLLKYNVAKLVGVTDEGEIRVGSLMDRVKKKLEKFNTYIQSEEGKKAINSWIDKFDDLLPKITKLGTTTKNKFEEIFGDDFITRLNDSIKNFKVDNLVNEFDRVKEKLESLYETIQNIGATAIGAKIGMFFGGVPGAIIGGVVGGTTSAIANGLDDNTEIIDNPNISTKNRMKAILNKKGMYDDPFNPYYNTEIEKIEEKVNNVSTTNYQKNISNDYSQINTNNSINNDLSKEIENKNISSSIENFQEKIDNDYSRIMKKTSNDINNFQEKIISTSTDNINNQYYNNKSIEERANNDYSQIFNSSSKNISEILNDNTQAITNNTSTIAENFTSNLNNVSDNKYLEKKINNIKSENEYLTNYFNNKSIENKNVDNSNHENYSLNDSSNNSKETSQEYKSNVINSSYYQKPKLDFNITFDFKNSHITMDNFEEKLKSVTEKHFENIADKYFQDITLGFETSF